MSMKFPQSLKQKHWWWGGGHRHKHGTWLRMPGDGGGGGVRQTSTRCMATHPTSSPSPLHPHACCGHATPHACCGHATTPMHAVGMPPPPCMLWACMPSLHFPHTLFCWSSWASPEAARRMRTTSALPPWHAANRGEAPAWHSTLALAPAASRARTTSAWPDRHAKCRGVEPVLTGRSSWAPVGGLKYVHRGGVRYT